MKHRIGILGMTPQDVSDLKAADKMRELFQQKYDQAGSLLLYGRWA